MIRPILGLLNPKFSDLGRAVIDILVEDEKLVERWDLMQQPIPHQGFYWKFIVNFAPYPNSLSKDTLFPLTLQWNLD
ncbi:MAG: hypothetical protein ACM3UL_03400 [Ignavibacteria bacterium]